MLWKLSRQRMINCINCPLGGSSAAATVCPAVIFKVVIHQLTRQTDSKVQKKKNSCEILSSTGGNF